MSARESADRVMPEPVKGRISVVGVCSSGKTTLVNGLRALGYDARHCGQEHSYVPYMWQYISRPEVLVYLDASAEIIHTRRRNAYTLTDLPEQRRRLAHARAHCTIYILTDALDEKGVLHSALQKLAALGLAPR
jgi:hypothetical protein